MSRQSLPAIEKLEVAGRPPMSFDVFISYSTKDVATAKATCAALEGAKIRCWMAPRDIVPGARWGASIVRAINQCRVMVLIFSGNANASTQVHREVDQAFGKGKAVVPLRVEAVKPVEELAYYLDTVHWLDALTPPLEASLAQLGTTVRALLSAAGQEPVSETTADDLELAHAQDVARSDDEERERNAEVLPVAQKKTQPQAQDNAPPARDLETIQPTRPRSSFDFWTSRFAITGPVIYAGTIALTWWLVAASMGPAAYAWVIWLSRTVSVVLILAVPCYAAALLAQSLNSIGRLMARFRSEQSVYGPVRYDDIAALATPPLVVGMGLLAAEVFDRNNAAVVQIIAAPLSSIVVLLFILASAAQAVFGMNNVIDSSSLAPGVRFFAKTINVLCAAAIVVTAIVAVVGIRAY